MEITQSKMKPIKTGKEIGTRYWLGCKDYTHNFKPQEVKMTNKVLREKIIMRCFPIFKTKAQQQKIIQLFYKLMLYNNGYLLRKV